MLTIQNYDDNYNYRELNNNPQVFHEALKCVLKGERRFHINNGSGTRFDLVYTDNDTIVKSDPLFPQRDYYMTEIYYPPYFFYDEADTDRIMLHMFDGFDEIFFEEVNEYTLVIADVALRNTSLTVTFKDRRIKLFDWLSSKVSVNDKPQSSNPLYVQKDFYVYFYLKGTHYAVDLFHDLFMLQWLTDLPLDQIKYLEFSVRKTEGIGSILTTYMKVCEAFKDKGIQVYIAPNCTRYSEKMLNKYFRVGGKPNDANESNTAYAVCFNAVVLNSLIQQNDVNLDLSIIQPDFLSEMEEYADGLIGGKKVLGVLLRGTDIALANFTSGLAPADIGDCIRLISKRMEEYQYDKIFLATEDSSLLEKMLSAFPGKVITVSQERHRVSDFKNSIYISDLEKKEHSGDEYLASVEDTTVNYFYALYMLSRCESLVANCICSGLRMATSLNQGKFVRTDIVSLMDKNDI